MRREKLDLKDSKKARVPMRGTGAEHFVVAVKPRNGGGSAKVSLVAGEVEADGNR
jgi:hypothetical protein